MSNIQGVTFANQAVTPAASGALYRAALLDGFLAGGALSYSGSTLTMAAGWFLAAGRVVRLNAANTFNVNGATSGYARLRLKLDLTATATESVWQQGEFYLDYAATLGGFAALTQEDLNESGSIYEVELAVVSLSASGISAITRQIGNVGNGLRGDIILTEGVNYGTTLPTPGKAGRLFLKKV